MSLIAREHVGPLPYRCTERYEARKQDPGLVCLGIRCCGDRNLRLGRAGLFCQGRANLKDPLSQESTKRAG